MSIFTRRRMEEAQREEAVALMELAMAMSHDDPEYKMTEREIKSFAYWRPKATVQDFYEHFMAGHDCDAEHLNPFLPIVVMANLNEAGELAQR